MRALTTSELLLVWEQALSQQPPDRALTLLAAACPEMPADGLAKLTIGERDGWLMTLREWTFGPRLVSLATCPSCGERLELNFNVADVQATPKAQPPDVYSVRVENHDVQFRLPNSLDLAAVHVSADPAESRDVLLRRCVLSVRHNGNELSPDQMPEQAVDELTREMEEADPQAEVQLAISCASCGHRWQSLFDIVSFFWTEIDTWARRVLGEVHALATAYGWSEADILAMSPWRRQLYLNMAHR